MFGLVLPLALLILLIGLAVLAFEVWMFVNAIQNRKISDEARILWLIGMVLVHPFIAIAYYFTDYQKTG
jgi:hypothetical protein